MEAAQERFARLSGTSAERLLALEPRMRAVVLGQLELVGSRRVARELGRLLEAPWWAALDEDDRIRAARVVTHMSACADGSPHETTEPCRRMILDNTLDSLLSAHGGFGLAFEDLPLVGDTVVAGACRPPDTVVLNRLAISTEELRIGEGCYGAIEARVGLATLVHEVNHLHNPTPAGPTFEAFQDEYRAWYVDFVAEVARVPRRAEALERCRELVTSPSYAALGRAVTEGTEHGQRIVEFMGAFGSVRRWTDVLALRIDDPVGAAPLPRPLANMSNAPRGPRARTGA